MRGLTRRWIVHSSDVGTEAQSLITRVLRARGIGDADDIARFCEPKLTDLHDPGLLPNIDNAVRRVIDAIGRDELIVIYGDYDVDGITASAILYHVIKAIAPAARVRTYVPHRLEEGYGINCEALRQLRHDGANLVISVDCGITAVASANTAREIGLDLIITDHHSVPGSTANELDDHPSPLPQCVAVVHPCLPGSRYPFGELCGAGVAFKLAWRLATTWCNSERVADSLRQTLMHMLPLAALGTIADVVPLVGENRIIAAFGLRLLRGSPLPGVRAMIDNANLAGDRIDSEKVGFILAPRLNACGRMGHAAEAVRMLTEASLDEARTIAAGLAKQNAQRQRVERAIFEQAARLAEDRGMTRDDHRAIVLAHPDWHPGVVGIVCSRLVERFGRPTILMQQQPDLCKGSARSIDGFSIHAALNAVREHLQSWGGHAMAAGLMLSPARLDDFARAIIEHANAHITVDQLVPALAIDCDAHLGELDVATVQRLHALAPFGRGNRAPIIRVRGVIVHEPPKQMGSEGRHLQLRLRQDHAATLSFNGTSSPHVRGAVGVADHAAITVGSAAAADLMDTRSEQDANAQRDGRVGGSWSGTGGSGIGGGGSGGGGGSSRLRAVWWRGAEHADSIAAGMRLDLAIEPKINEWNGTRSVEAELRDVRICDT